MKSLTKILGALVLTLAVAQSPGQSALSAGAIANPAQPASGTDIPAAHPISTVDPKYPEEARKQKRQGTVVLHVKIGEDGKAQDLSVVSGDPDFAAAATQAVKKWRFQPYLVDGKPTEAEQSVTVNFKLENDAAGTSSAQAQSNDDFNQEVDRRIAAGELFRAGKGVTPPKLLFMKTPQYTQAAKDARIQGTAVIQLIVGTDGVPGRMYGARALGYGLDDKAMETVSRWTFKPATKDGQPVAAVINVEVAFHFY